MRKLAKIRPESSVKSVFFKKTGKFKDDVPLYEYNNPLKLEQKTEDDDEEDEVELD
jgi:hypothetical protein